MDFALFLPLASIEAVRPVFMIVMGVSLAGIAWRMARETEGWAARLMIAGALLLCFGYAILVPLYETGKIERYHPSAHLHDPSTALAWHAVKQLVMNGGWLIFGLGVGIHSGLLRMPKLARSATVVKPSISSHESPA